MAYGAGVCVWMSSCAEGWACIRSKTIPSLRTQDMFSERAKNGHDFSNSFPPYEGHEQAHKTPPTVSWASPNGMEDGSKTTGKGTEQCRRPSEPILNRLAPNESGVWSPPKEPRERSPAVQNSFQSTRKKANDFGSASHTSRNRKNNQKRMHEDSKTARRGDASRAAGRSPQNVV